MRRFLLFCACLVSALWVAAQIQEPVKFQSELKELSAGEAEIIFTATIANGWHVYSTDMGDDGPVSASFHAEELQGATLVGTLKPQGKEISAYDSQFDAVLRYFEHTAQFVQRVKLTGGPYLVEGYLEYGACNDETCLPPTAVSFRFAGKAEAAPAGEAAKPAATADAAATAGTAATATTADASATAPASAPAGTAADASDNATQTVPDSVSSLVAADAAAWWQPVKGELKPYGDDSSLQDMSWLYIFLTGFMGGLLALFTPCVWPIIPMTVSFFLKRSKDKRKGIRDAWTYGASIVVIYVTLGLLVTWLFGANKLNELSTNAFFNIFFFLLLLVFAASFLGAFEIALPSRWSNAVDSKAEATTGLLSIFLMAFVLCLVSFSCTGPIIGFLLVQVSTMGNVVGPAVGMLGFALALALPFTLFAMFPSWLKSMPKSGGWMNSIKVTLGFIELAFALKFLSVADLAYGWRLLDRETFLALWIVLFALLGLYLLGKIKFPHDDEGGKVSVPRFFLALASLAFAVYMVPGLWGAPLKAVSAFAPPMHTQDFNLYTKEIRPQFKDYEAGMAYAREHRMPVMIDFTGNGCVNCRKMELAVWIDKQVSDIINNDYVLISLYVDDKTPLPERIRVKEANGAETTLRTVGDKWSYLQRLRFNANTQPFYVLLGNDGQPLLDNYFSYKEDVPLFVDFLKTGVKNYR